MKSTCLPVIIVSKVQHLGHKTYSVSGLRQWMFYTGSVVEPIYMAVSINGGTRKSILKWMI